MNSGKVVLGVLAGVAIGAMFGILFAPDKGSNTRRKISQKRDDYIDELEEKFNDFTDSIADKFDTVKDGATRIVKNGKQKVEDIESEVISSLS
ncbi:MAG: YtxH domain-containing protein [Bacteroidota bacterium]